MKVNNTLALISMKLLVNFWMFSVSGRLIQKGLRFPAITIYIILVGWFTENEVSAKQSNPVLPPVAICKDISVQLGEGGTVTVSGSEVDNGSYDPDGTISNLSVIPNTFSCSQTGPNNVVLTVTDNEGLSSTCNATVTVTDRTPPLMKCRNHTLYLDASGNGSISVADINIGSTDNCSAGLFLYLDRTTFSCSDIGTTSEVSLIGTDASGNSSSCISLVTVLDTISPVINVKPFTLLLGSSGTASLAPSDIDNGTYDNCGGVTLSVTPNTYTCSDLGLKTVTFSAFDEHGNFSSRNVTITVATTLDIAGISLSTCDLSPSLGLFDADIEGGNGNYSYLWKGIDPESEPFMVIIPLPASLIFSNTSTIESPFFNNSMDDGYYDIRLIVTDGNGCADSSQIMVNATGAIFNNLTMRYSEACEGEIKTYSVNYKKDGIYSWSVDNGTILSSNPDTSRISIRWNQGVVQGRIVTTIREPNILFSGGQCESMIIDTVTITPVPTPLFSNPVMTACSDSESTYTLTGSYAFQQWNVAGGVITAGGKTPDNFVTVRWGNGSSGSISVSAGNNPLCTGSVILNVTISNLSGVIVSKTDISCNGRSDGSVTVSAVPGTGQAPFVYSLNGGAFQPGGTFTGLTIGNHFIRIRDASFCEYELPFVIHQPVPVSGLVTSQTDIACFGELTGSVTILASGGTGPYQYRLNTGAFQSSDIFSGLAAGSYTVTIQDSHGCTGVVRFTISQPAAPLAGSVSVTNISCFGESTGRVDLTVTGGMIPYTFLWSNGATTEDLTNVSSGTYSVVVTDKNGCKETVNATVSQPASALSATAVVTNVLCYGGITGAVDMTVTSGTAPYSFTWNTGASTEDLANIPAGNYSVIVTDANSCSANLEIIVAGPPSAVGGTIVSQKNVSCFGGNDGSFTVNGSGGTAPYDYRLGTGAFQSSGIFGSLTAGTYSITVRDGNLCTFILPVTITQPSAALTGNIQSTNVRCFGDNSGKCDLTVSGGTPPYSYLWNNGAQTEDITSISAGNYSVTVTDSNGCQTLINAVITQPSAPLTGVILSRLDVSVYGGNDGSITISGSGGTSPFEYSLNEGIFQSSGTFGSLVAGDYNITLRDAAMCTHEISVTITQPWIPLTANIITQTKVSCQGGNDGIVTVAGWGGTLPYLYSLEGGKFQESGTFGSLSAGTYTIAVRDAASDVFYISVTIVETEALHLTGSGVDIHCYGGNTGSVSVAVTGGTAPYTYSWNTEPVQITQTATNVRAGTYTVTVTDANGCTAFNNVTISQPAEDMIITVAQTNILCAGESNGSAIATVTGGLAPYTFSWDTSPEQTKETITDLSAGTYTITVTDSYGCKRTSPVVISEPQPVRIESSVSPASCPGSGDGSINLSISGGTGQYNVEWTDETSGQNRTNVSPGSYTALVTDQNGCQESVTVNVDFTYSFNCVLIPQVITPNNDGFNDEWRIQNIDLYPNAEVRIFNRWGKMIFSTRNLSDNPWDGTIDGKPAPTDSYHYILYLNDGTEPKSGVISVIR